MNKKDRRPIFILFKNTKRRSTLYSPVKAVPSLIYEVGKKVVNKLLCDNGYILETVKEYN